MGIGHPTRPALRRAFGRALLFQNQFLFDPVGRRRRWPRPTPPLAPFGPFGRLLDGMPGHVAPCPFPEGSSAAFVCIKPVHRRAERISDLGHVSSIAFE